MSLERHGKDARQLSVLERLVASIEDSEIFVGAILIGSLATGPTDELSDLDLLLIAPQGAFERAWGYRTELHITGSLASWDEVHDENLELGAHKWLTPDLVLVECLVATPSSGVRLAEPFVVLAGPPDLADRIARRKAIPRSTMREATHPVERAYDELKRAVRGTRAPSLAGDETEAGGPGQGFTPSGQRSDPPRPR